MTAFRQAKPGYIPTEEELAMTLHESGREAVLNNKVLKKDGGNPIRFFEWNELPEEAREGRRIQARFLLKQYHLMEREYKKPLPSPEALIAQFTVFADTMVRKFTVKNHDYGSAFLEEGVVGVMLRMKEKLNRFISVSNKGTNLVTDEKLDDTLLDLAVYAIMALITRMHGMNNEEQTAGVLQDGKNIFLGNISASDIPKLKELMDDKGKQIDKVIAVVKPGEKNAMKDLITMAKETLKMDDDSSQNRCSHCGRKPATLYKVGEGDIPKFYCDTCVSISKRQRPSTKFEKA